MMKLDPSAVFRQLEEGGVILNIETGDYYQVNASGRFIWEKLLAGIERADLIQTFAEEFDVDQRRAAADIGDFVNELKARSLVTIAD